MTTPDTTNDFALADAPLPGVPGRRCLRPVLPVVATTRQQAYRLAAWLRAMALVLPEEAGQEGVTADQVQTAVDAT